MSDDLELREFVILTECETGVNGTIRIWSREGEEDPFLEWFHSGPSSGDPDLKVFLATPDHELGSLTEWVRLNHDALLWFWENGVTMLYREVTHFVKTLKRVDGTARKET